MPRIRITRTWTAVGLVLLAVQRPAPSSGEIHSARARRAGFGGRGNRFKVARRLTRIRSSCRPEWSSWAESRPSRPRSRHSHASSMRGSSAYDPNRLVPVHTRFPGQVVEIATVDDPAVKSPGIVPSRHPVRYTDHVSKGQRLAVLWSKDLGEKKSELVDAQAKLKLHEKSLSLLKQYSDAISDRTLAAKRKRRSTWT